MTDKTAKSMKAIIITSASAIVIGLIWVGAKANTIESNYCLANDNKIKIESLQKSFYESEIIRNREMIKFYSSAVTQVDLKVFKDAVITHIDTKIKYIDDKVDWEHELKNNKNE